MTPAIVIAAIVVCAVVVGVITGVIDFAKLRRASRLERLLEAHNRDEADLERILRKEGGDE